MSGKTFTSTEYEITDRYFRAIAKIAFHYILKHFPQFRGDEEIFSAIRNFIINGGNIPDFVRWSEKQVIEIKEGYTPSTFAHLITARATQEYIWSRLQFFLGPHTTPFVYRVSVGRNETTLVYDVSSGHSFVYYEDGPKNGFVGQMDPLIWIHKPSATK